ncbi:alpha/beta fold hydrolase [Actinoallomurus vinaceus]|uniref:Alpha/beta fold hydrolase n=1 Tax=Actinoallomurus vinaceus TaxID=1080074 RepID=A0ABP8UGL7_9ACTN
MTHFGGYASWIRSFHNAGDSTHRLLCFPYAGGSAGYFFPLSAALSPAVQVLGVQYPGRQDRYTEPAIEDLAEIADKVASLIGTENHSRLVLLGHSMGALIAFETAKRLELNYGVAPVKLIVSGMQAPSRHRGTRHWDGDEPLVNEIRLLHGTDPAFFENEELRELFLPVLRSDYKAVCSYRGDVHTVLSCPITAFLGRADPRVSRGDVSHWAGHTSSGLSVRMFSGDHFYLNGFPPDVVDAVKSEIPHP